MYNLVTVIIPVVVFIFGFVTGSPKNPLDGKGNHTMIEGVKKNVTTCSTENECLETYTPGIENGLLTNITVIHKPQCLEGICTCGRYCLSKSLTFMEDEFYYCGPCGRVGSTCNSTCSYKTAICGEDGFCHCYNGGEFYEASFCFLPFYGYEFALEMAIVTCIIIIFGLLVASLYSTLGTRRLQRLRSIRAFLREQNGTMESPPGDFPPKYDDVMQDLPTYQEALTMTMANGHDAIADEGVINLAYQEAENSEGIDGYRCPTGHEALQTQTMPNDHPRRVTSNNFQDQIYVAMAPQSTQIEANGILSTRPEIEARIENVIHNPNQTPAIATTSFSSLELPSEDQNTNPLPILSSLKSYAADRKDALGETLEATDKIGNNHSQSKPTAVRDKRGNSTSSHTSKPSTNFTAHNSCIPHEMSLMSTTNGEDAKENLAKSESIV